MTGCGTTTYTDPDDFRLNVPGVSIALERVSDESFKARVAWVKMRHVGLASIDEAAPRSACVSAAALTVVLSFPLRGEPLWNGHKLGCGDIVLQAPGARLHQVAENGTRWGLIALARKDLAAYGRTLLGTRLKRIDGAQVLRPRAKAANALLRVHTRACRLAATKPDIMAHREVARAIEQELIVALVNVVANAESA